MCLFLILNYAKNQMITQSHKIFVYEMWLASRANATKNLNY